MDGEGFSDPILELATRTGGDVMALIDIGATEEEAAATLLANDEVDAEMAASSIASRLRQLGHIL